MDARVTAPPVVAGGTVYLPDWEGTVHALGVADGSVRWARPVGSDQESRTLAKPVAVQDDTLFVGSHTGRTGVAAVDAETGETMWTKSTHRVIAGPVVDDRLVVVKGGSVLRAFDTDGTDRWAFNIPGDVPGIPIAVDDQHVYVSTRKRLDAITRSGREAWTYEPDDEDVGPPTVVGNEVVVPVGDGLTALAHADGATRWHTETDGYGSVVVTPSAMFMAASGGRIIGLGTG
nr:PQQ-binding-like beta-propeller repeat protein [Halorhabdus sp. BNX81]